MWNRDSDYFFKKFQILKLVNIIIIRVQDMLRIKVVKVVSATFLLVCFLSLKESFCQNWEECFLFHFKSFFLFLKSKFRILDIQVSWRHQMPNLGSKHSLLMKFTQFSSYYKRKNFIKKLCKNCDLKTSSRLFWVCKELSTASIGKWNFWSNLLTLHM